MSFVSEVTADSPAIWFRFAEGSGTAVVENSGAATGGTYAGTPSWVTSLHAPATSDQAIRLNGSTQYASIPDQASLDFASSITLEVLFTWAGGGLDKVLLQKGNGATANYYLDYRDGGSGIPAIGFWCDGSFFRAFTYTLTPGPPYHLMAVYSNSAQTARLYVNGVEITPPSTGLAGAPTVNTDALLIGANAGPTQFWPGTIDEVVIYGSPLAGARAAAHAAAASTAPVLFSTHRPVRTFSRS